MREVKKLQNNALKTEYFSERVSLGCIALCAVWFMVLSQVPLLRMSETITMSFRPILILVLLINMLRRGSLQYSVRLVSFAAATWCCFVVLLNDIDLEALKYAGGVVMYMLMFWAVIGIRWNRKELRIIICIVFISCIICAAAILYSNPITDFSVAIKGHLNFLGTSVNRNKNAYVFSLGTVIGLIYLMYGHSIPKLLIFLGTTVTGYALMYSQCRGAFICVVAAVFVLVGFRLHEIGKKQSLKALCLSLLFLVFVIASYYLIKNSELSRLVDGESTSGREIGFRRAWEMFVGSDYFGKLFGNGFMFESRHSDEIGAHLVYLNFLVSSGIVGTLFIVAIMLSSLRHIKGCIPYALYSLALIKTLFEGMEYNFYAALILAVITYNYTITYGGSIDELFSGTQ